MNRYDLNDTIAAISTSLGESGIGIVRLSGKDALGIADKIFVSKDNKKPSVFKTHTLHYGWICGAANNIVDEVLLTVMRSPRTYTKEDIVEINCHGGLVAMRAVLDLVLANGARLAEAGEFTKRAFLNGRLDLAQSEAVLDIIKAKTDSALKVGTEQLRGVLSKELKHSTKILLDTLAILEANIDFPEDNIDVADLGRVSDELKKINSALKGILFSFKRGRIFREGIHIVICGLPNVGKSSLLNALLKHERSIVTPVAGTTRDTIEEIIDIRGIPVRIVDTAGIIEPRDLVEKKAVARSKRYIDLADLVILLFDGTRKLSKDDLILVKKLKDKHVLAIINKIDLRQNIEKEKIAKEFKDVLEISAKKIKNIESLEDAIANAVYGGKVGPGESVLVSNSRHAQKIHQAQKLIADSLDSLDNKMSLEFVAQNVKDAILYLEEILGRRFSEQLLDKIFSEFCIGK